MILNDDLSRVVADYLEEVKILNIGTHFMDSPTTLKALYDSGVIDDSLVESSLEKAVFRQARQDYEFLLNPRVKTIRHADHVQSPHSFAYALAKGEFSEVEIGRIPFNHGDTAKTFTDERPDGEYLPDLISSLRKKVLGIEEPAVITEYSV